MTDSRSQEHSVETIARARIEFDHGVKQYLRAIHFSRVAIAAVAIVIAVVTIDEIPVAHPFGIVVPILGLGGMALVAARWRWIQARIAINPRIVWLDPLVLVGLMVLNKP